MVQQDNENPLRFDQSTSQNLGFLARVTTVLQRNLPRAVGGSRILAELANGFSGLQFNSMGRFTGALFGLAAHVTLLAFGRHKQNLGSEEDTPKKESRNIWQKLIRPHQHPIESASGFALAAACFYFISGVAVKRPFETIKGIMMLSAFTTMTFMPERKANNPTLQFEKSESVALGDTAGIWQKLKTSYAGRPMKIGSDIMTGASLFTIADGVHQRDPSVLVAGIIYFLSNVAMRTVRRSEHGMQKG